MEIKKFWKFRFFHVFFWVSERTYGGSEERFNVNSKEILKPARGGLFC